MKLICTSLGYEVYKCININCKSAICVTAKILLKNKMKYQ